VLAAIFFITRMSGLTQVRELEAPGTYGADTDQATPAGTGADRPVRVYELFGSLFFGAANKIEPLLALAEPTHPAKVIVLDMQKLINVDTTGLDMLSTLHRKLLRNDKRLFIAGANAQPRSLFERSGFAATLGADNLCDDVATALLRAGAGTSSATAPMGD
jgi:SulP family sulfate permease